MKIEKIEQSFVVKTYIHKERIASLDRFRWWPCLADREEVSP